MALRGVKPKAVEKRLKALFFGPAGVGKTTAAIQFSKPYLIDTERGAENDQYVKLLEQGGGAYFFTTDFDEMVKEIMSLLTEKHEYRTVIIDPLTVLYNDLVDKNIKRIARMEKKDEDDKEVTAFGRHKTTADRQVKHLLNLLLRLDMNVIITSHMKKRWGAGMVELGNTFDCYAKLDYLFDLVFEIQKRGKERVGVVHKTRIETFPEGETFPFNYDTIADKYGREILERVAQVEVLASAEQVAEMKRLVELLKVPGEVTDKWLDKAKADSFPELPAEVIAKCINHLTEQVRGTATAAA